MGFVDLEAEAYRFYGCVREDTPADAVEALTELASATFADSNIHFELVRIDQQKDHPALKHLALNPPASFPVGVLVSPDGQALSVTLSKPGESIRQTMLAALRDIVSSPTREEMVQQASETFGVVLLMEGPQAGENERARQAITGAIDRIKTQMKSMPKLIARPPTMLVIDAASFAREQILLWSLHLENGQVDRTRAAVIYGRARWMGPLMKGEEITEQNLAGILSIIGADCECGLDLSWTQGTRLPIRWDAKRQTEIARLLGFDPENPLVKIEVSRIVGRGGGRMGSIQANAGDARVSGNNSQAGAGSLDAKTNIFPTQAPPNTNMAPARTYAVEEPLPLKRLWSFLAGMAVVVLGTGFWIVWRAAGKS